MSRYDKSLSTNRDKIRLLVGDTNNDSLMLEDEEIEFLLTNNSDALYLTAADACEIIAAKFARDVNYRFSTLWQDAGDAYDHYMNLAERYRKTADETETVPLGLSFQASDIMDVDDPAIFWVGITDNPPVPSADDD